VDAAPVVSAIAIFPKQPHSAHLTRTPLPSVGPEDVLAKTVLSGICGTDREIVEGKLGAAPDGAGELVIGHETLAIVEETGANVTQFKPGDLVTATVRRPCGCPPCRAGQVDFCEWHQYTERGIERIHGYMAERWVEHERYLIPVPAELGELGILIEPMTIAEKALRQALAIQQRIAGWHPRQALVYGSGPIGLLATLMCRVHDIPVVVLGRKPADCPAARIIQAAGGEYRSIAGVTPFEAVRDRPPVDFIVECTGQSEPLFIAMQLLANNGVLAALSVTGDGGSLTVPADAINLSFMLGNKVLVGCVNAHRDDFLAAADDLVKIERRWPGLAGQIITHRYRAEDAVDRIGKPVAGTLKAVLAFDN
jgi:threonine dehydrogenase-like Zn-dependent dehydrogenase